MTGLGHGLVCGERDEHEVLKRELWYYLLGHRVSVRTYIDYEN